MSTVHKQMTLSGAIGGDTGRTGLGGKIRSVLDIVNWRFPIEV